MQKFYFFFAFQLSKSIIFEVKYYKIDGNKNPQFSTFAALFNKPKTDFNRCGQAQEGLLPPFKEAYALYRKWDELHTEDLSAVSWLMLVKDLEILKERYNYIESKEDIRFSDLVKLSKLPVKHVK